MCWLKHSRSYLLLLWTSCQSQEDCKELNFTNKKKVSFPHHWHCSLPESSGKITKRQKLLPADTRITCLCHSFLWLSVWMRRLAVKRRCCTVYRPIKDMMAVPMILLGNLKYGSHSYTLLWNQLRGLLQYRKEGYFVWYFSEWKVNRHCGQEIPA